MNHGFTRDWTLARGREKRRKGIQGRAHEQVYGTYGTTGAVNEACFFFSSLREGRLMDKLIDYGGCGHGPHR
jgi:hypothetical protein